MNKLSGANLLRQKLKTVSERAGVYRMLDGNGNVLYVGKAKNLKKRLTNYTRPDRLSYRIRQMVAETADLMTIETAGEAEAFILESDLIKQFRPPYNILLKDDKSYPYILVTREDIPRLLKYRGARTVRGDYFGPFPSGLAVKETIKTLQKIFGLRTCNNTYFKNRSRPCLLYQIGRCSAPCTGQISPADYHKNVRQTLAFLRGEHSTLQDELTQKMQDFSARQEYEQAALVRDKLLALNRIQDTRTQNPIDDTDVIGFYRRGETACIQVFFYRSGQNGGNSIHLINHLGDDSDSDILGAFLMQFYDRISPPKQVCLPLVPPDGLEQALSQRAESSVHLTHPRRGQLARLVDQAVQNATQSYRAQVQASEIRAEVWDELRQLLHLPRLDKVEVYDNSHIQGAFAVGAMIAATADGFQKNLYRRFNIDGTRAQTNDDFGMMREVLTRRLTRGLAEGDLPSALLIDGGKGQLSSVLSILNELRVDNLAVLAIAKGEKRNAGLETFYLGTDPDTPIRLDLKGDLIHLLQRLRDEAHRFAIGSHRARRAKNMFHESLTDIEDIGDRRKKALMLHFGSAREIAGASVEQLTHVPGISRRLAEKIYAFYHG